jgi:hypothetical protein
MTKLIQIDDLSFLNSDSWKENNKTYCQELESGNILFFPKCPLPFPQEEVSFLLEQRQTGSANRKNIAYKPQSDKITNFVQSSPAQGQRLHEIMRTYSQRVSAFLSQLLAPYAPTWRLDYASFRPFQEKGRQLRTRARNDLLHVDSFPSRPMHGARILRFFTNINPTESRHWLTTLPFHDLAAQFGGSSLPFPKGIEGTLFEKIAAQVKCSARALGLPLVLRSPYDAFMLNLHNFLKENTEFQKTCPKDHWDFPPNSCWIVYTDLVSHAATAGQYALEQTLIIPKEGMVNPEKAPVSTLEKLAQKQMINSAYQIKK